MAGSVAGREAELESKLETVTAERDTLRSLYLRALETIKRLELGLLGPKTEKLPNDAQLTFDILSLVMGGTPRRDETAPPDGEDSEDERPEDRPKPTGRRAKPRDLPRLDVEVLPPEVQEEGLNAFKRIGEETAEVTKRRRGGTVVVCYRRPKFVRKDPHHTRAQDSKRFASGDEQPSSGTANEEAPAGPESHAETKTEVLVAPTPDLPIERGTAGPALLAETIVRRWLDAMPLHRMERMYAREGLPLARSTMCGWHESLAELVKPLVSAMHQEALQAPVLCTDATGVRIQAKDRCAQGHFFVVIALNLHILFFYTKDHNREAVDEIFDGYQGFLVADAHRVYDHLFAEGEIVEVGDWAHARRYYHKSLESDPERAKVALGRIAALFRIERELKDLEPIARAIARKKRSQPIVNDHFAWCQEQALAVIDDTPIQKAIRYSLNQRDALRRFLEDGRLPLHNNWSEAQLRREAVGRKNWMFLGV